jgi:hypothetical protein
MPYCGHCYREQLVRPKILIVLIVSLSFQSIEARKRPTEANLSPEFSEAALKALSEYRDGSDSPAVFERVEASAISATEKEGFKGIKAYSCALHALCLSV